MSRVSRFRPLGRPLVVEARAQLPDDDDPQPADAEVLAPRRHRGRRLGPRIEGHPVVLEDQRRVLAEADPHVDVAGRPAVIDDVGHDLVEHQPDVVAQARMQRPGVEDQAQGGHGVAEAGRRPRETQVVLGVHERPGSR